MVTAASAIKRLISERSGTFLCWIRTMPFEARGRIDLISLNRTTPAGGFRFGLEHGSPMLQLETVSGSVLRAPSLDRVDLRDGVWHLVGFSILENRSVRLHADGKTIFTGQVPGSWSDFLVNEALMFGGGSDVATDASFRGDMDEMSLEPLLSAEAILQRYKSGGADFCGTGLELSSLYSPLSGVQGQPFLQVLGVAGGENLLQSGAKLQLSASAPIEVVSFEDAVVDSIVPGSPTSFQILLKASPGRTDARIGIWLKSNEPNLRLQWKFSTGTVPVQESNGIELPIALGGDRDHDGIDDAWEAANGFSAEDAADGTSDPDGDGVLTRDEFSAGTDPWVAGSVLKPRVTLLDNSRVSLGWSGVAGRFYQILRMDSLGGPARVMRELRASSSGELQYQEVLPATGDGYFRILVLP